MKYGKRFKNFREKAGYTQKEAAERIGVKSYQLANYECGRSEPSLDTLKMMSQVYKVSIDKLLNNVVVHGAEAPVIGTKIDLDDLVERLTEITEDINKLKGND